MDNNLIEKIKNIKKSRENEGFIILGVFGSYGRNEENKESDIDILYELTDDFYNKYPGWDIIPMLDEIESQFNNELGIKPDLVNKNAMNNVAKKNILPEVTYV